MKKLLLVIAMLVPCFVQTHELQEKLTLCSGQALQYFIAAEKQNSLLSYESMVQIFSAVSTKYSVQRKEIRKDINACRQFIRMHAQDSVVHQELLRELLDLYDYVKEHKECCRAIQFHNQLQQRHKFAFNNPNIVQCVEATPSLYGVGRCKYKCRAYFNKIAADLRKIDRFEDTIHGNHGVLKAHNYVYKIELIKIRNYIYHHNIYKFETRYF